MDTSGTEMHKPTWFSNNLTLGNIITLGAMLAAGAYGYGELAARIDGRVATLTLRLDNVEQFRVERVRASDAKFADISKSLEGLPNLAYRVTATEEALKASNQRLDASLSNISARLAEMNQALGAIDTKVAVLTQRMEASNNERRADAAAASRVR